MTFRNQPYFTYFRVGREEAYSFGVMPQQYTRSINEWIDKKWKEIRVHYPTVEVVQQIPDAQGKLVKHVSKPHE